MFKKICLGFILLLILGFPLRAQEEISVEELISQALDNSHVLNANDQLVQRARVRNTEGFAGNLPSLDLSGEGRYELNSSRFQFFDGEVSNARFASNYSAGGSIDITYPLFESGAKDIRKNRLIADVDQSVNTFQLDKQDIVLEVLQAAVEYQFHRQQLQSYRQDTSYWHELLELRQQIMDYGRGTRVDLIQIRSELNASKAQLQRSEQQLFMAETRLRNLAFLEEERKLGAIDMETFLNRQEVQNTTMSSPLLEREEIEIRQSELSMELAKTLRYPVVSAFAGYGYSWSRNAVGILLSNQNFGPYAGLRLNWNIYDGNRTKTEIESAELQMAANKADYDAVQRDLEYEEKRLRGALNRQESILQQEQKQHTLLQEQIEIIQEQYNEGRISILEVLNFQRQILVTQLNIATAEYQIRNYQIQLLYTNGNLASI